MMRDCHSATIPRIDELVVATAYADDIESTLFESSHYLTRPRLGRRLVQLQQYA